MGNSHNNTNIRKSCTSFEGYETATKAFFGDSFMVEMINMKQNDNTEIWVANYKIGKKLEHDVELQLQAKHDNNGVESIFIVLVNYANNQADDTLVNIKRVGGDGLHGGITVVKSSGPYSTFISDEQDYSIETTIISYVSSYRDSFLVLQMKKMKYSNIAFKVAVAHYYVTETVGLYVEATICRNKDKKFVVEVNGPFKYQSSYLRKIMDETRLSGIWSPGGKPSRESGDSNSSLNRDNLVVGQIVKHASNQGLINSNGYTNGSLNNSIFCTIM